MARPASVTCNLVPAPEINASTNNGWCMKQDMEQAKKLLDDAGWMPGRDGVREKDGAQALDPLPDLDQLGAPGGAGADQAVVGGDSASRSSSATSTPRVFFGGDPGSPDTLQKFYADVEMYANNFDGTDPEKYSATGSAPRCRARTTQWQGGNISRCCIEEFDALHRQAGQDRRRRGRAARSRSSSTT